LELNSIAANSWRSPEIMITLGTVWNALKSAALSVGNPDQESVTASCDQRDVKGTEETMNLKVQVPFTLMCVELQKMTNKLGW
jgi:hypothetical protein